MGFMINGKIFFLIAVGEMVGQYMKDIYVDEEIESKFDMIDFEMFARIVAIVLEDANKINEANMEQDQVEQSFLHAESESQEEYMME